MLGQLFTGLTLGDVGVLEKSDPGAVWLWGCDLTILSFFIFKSKCQTVVHRAVWLTECGGPVAMTLRADLSSGLCPPSSCQYRQPSLRILSRQWRAVPPHRKCWGLNIQAAALASDRCELADTSPSSLSPPCLATPLHCSCFLARLLS